MRVLGVDPGLTRCGVGVIDADSPRSPHLVDVGVVRTSPHMDQGHRLLAIEEGLNAWVQTNRPDVIAVERVFAQHNVMTVTGTAQAAGIAMLVAARHAIPVALHT
ncbi:MAG: crossover junction endodeoxyribonuclease RuvC, partial [Propionibacterium sp.]|nr:crossover junction endodeoxyribonuclease RuvC [Propionibacterium sp.]